MLTCGASFIYYLYIYFLIHLFIELTSLSFCLCRTHLSWSVCPCPSPRERAWHVSVLVKTTVERRATSPCNHPLHHRPPAVLLTLTRHRRVEKAREGWEEAEERRGKEEERRGGTEGRERLWESLGTSGLCFSSGTVCCSVALGTFQMRTWKREQQWKDRKNGPL